MGRAARAPSIPKWIEDIQFNRFDAAAESLGETGIGNSIFRGLTTSGPDVRGAQMRADAEFARTIAKELQQSINVHLASSASGGINEATKEAIGEITQINSEVEMSGARVVKEFWQNVEDKDPSNGRITKSTLLYRFYAFNRDDWAAITGGYVQKILDQLPLRLQPDEEQVRTMLQNMLNDARRPIELNQQQLEQQLEAQQKMIDAQIGLMPAEQRAAAKQELARINSQTAIALGEQRADASVQRAEASAAASAEQAAYASGNSVLTAAASTTAADAVLVNAARLAAKILF
jgi:hypothetical protein